jgi:hypothetical protein
MKTLRLTALLFLAACGPLPMGGEGETGSGEPLIAEALLGIDGTNTVKITSARGWTCTGTYARPGNSTTRQFPLACSNGAQGQAVMSVNSVQQRATVAFTLSNGQSGRVAFGIVS